MASLSSVQPDDNVDDDDDDDDVHSNRSNDVKKKKHERTQHGAQEGTKGWREKNRPTLSSSSSSSSIHTQAALKKIERKQDVVSSLSSNGTILRSLNVCVCARRRIRWWHRHVRNSSSSH